METISPQKNSEPIKDSTVILSKAVDATNDKNELPPKQVSDKNPPIEKSNVNKDNTKNVNQTEKAKNSVSENSPNVKVF